MNTAKVDTQLIKQLRLETGAGISQCQRALLENAGNLADAKAQIEKNSLLQAQKKADRLTPEGCLAVAIVKDTSHKAVLIEINCETDFVARHEEFCQFGQAVADWTLQNDSENMTISQIETFFQSARVRLVMRFGENIKIRRVVIAKGPKVKVYLHNNHQLAAAVVYTALDNEKKQASRAEDWLPRQIAATELSGCAYLRMGPTQSSTAQIHYLLSEGGAAGDSEALQVIHTLDAKILERMNQTPVVSEEATQTFGEKLLSEKLSLLACAQLHVGELEAVDKLETKNFATEVQKTLKAYE